MSLSKKEVALVFVYAEDSVPGKEHPLWRQFEGAGLCFILASRRQRGNLMTANSNLRKCYEENGAGLLKKGQAE